MEELIKEAEGLYLELSRITDSLVYARLHDDNDLLHGCRNELENYAQSVMQTFKCLVDSKDNIVDLGEVWHNIIEEPDGVNNIVINVDNDWCINISSIVYKDRWNSTVSRFAAKRWAYVKDLLPKGDNK